MNQCDQVCKTLYPCETNIYLPFERGQSPLLAASKGGHTETAQLLIDKGADVNQCDQVCTTLKHC